jgi:hypothetical protein
MTSIKYLKFLRKNPWIEEIKEIRQKKSKNKWAKSVIDLGTIINKPT